MTPPDSPQAAQPLFVLGVARSGTTFLHHVLSDHPGIRISYEGRLVREGDWAYRRAGDLSQRARFDALLDEFARWESEEPLNDWLVAVLRQQREVLFEAHRQRPGFAALVEAIYMQPAAVPCWGNKILRVEACPDLLARWPAARFVILVRDPRAVYASQRKFFGTRLGYSTIYWNLHGRWTREHATDPQRYVVFRYEDFVERPAELLGRVLEAGGVNDPGAVERMLAARPPHRASIEKWRETLRPDEVRRIEALCFDEMQRWGYAPEYATAPRRLSAPTRAWETFRENARNVPWDLDWWRRKQLLRRFFRTVRG